MTEQRHVKALARKEGSIGKFTARIFTLTLTVTGSYHAMCEEAVKAIRAEGYETYHILSHSVHRDCL